MPRPLKRYKVKKLQGGGTPEGEPMSDEDILHMLRVYATQNYGGPNRYDFLPAADTIAQVESGGVWDKLQTGGGPGGGGLQMEGFGRGGSGTTTTASNRLDQLSSLVGYDNPSWNIPENVDDASKLTETQQKILWLANMIRAEDVDLKSLATGETPLEDFWIKSHGRFPESDIPARKSHWSETISAMKAAQAKADATMEHVEETEGYKKGGKFTLKKKKKMKLRKKKFAKGGSWDIDDAYQPSLEGVLFGPTANFFSNKGRRGQHEAYEASKPKYVANPYATMDTGGSISPMQGVMKRLKMMFGGGSLPYDDYGMDDSMGMSYQNSSNQFMDRNSTLVGGIPQDSVMAQDPQFHVPVTNTKKEMRKEKSKAMTATRKAARDARKLARNPEKHARKQQMDLIKEQRSVGIGEAKSRKDWKDYT